MKDSVFWSIQGSVLSLLNSQDRDRLEVVLKYLEDRALRRWNLADTKAFLTGISDWRSKLNCITNPYMYEQVCYLILIILSCIYNWLVMSIIVNATTVKGQPMDEAPATVEFEKGRCMQPYLSKEVVCAKLMTFSLQWRNLTVVPINLWVGYLFI